MSKLIRAAVTLAAAGLLPGCMPDDGLHPIGVSKHAGNAIAANTVMQMVDPWSEGVDETDLRVPADRGGEEDAATPAPKKLPNP